MKTCSVDNATHRSLKRTSADYSCTIGELIEVLILDHLNKTTAVRYEDWEKCEKIKQAYIHMIESLRS